ncbi:MAG TPA: hypothetical protein VMQ60_07780 [Acidobacteriaceae bacterium]|jgi:hypothetical protein|nr:hypothetical protein [Acidobacteriaceae bacterium]
MSVSSAALSSANVSNSREADTEGYQMTVDEQERQCVRVRKELRAYKQELTVVMSDLKAIGEALLVEGKKLVYTLDSSNLDADLLCTEARTAVLQIARYKDLSAKIADKQAESDKFGDLVP